MKLILLSVMLWPAWHYFTSKAQKWGETYQELISWDLKKKDWNIVASQFADDFTFTSPAGDDHISLANLQRRDAGGTFPIR